MFLPKPGVMVHVSPPFNPPVLKGLKVHPDNPFQFDFVLDQGDSYNSLPPVGRTREGQNQEQLKIEANKLIKYFLAAITILDKDLWVNLSPYEKDRIIPDAFGKTEMGRDLLAQDYLLKQITASLIYPEEEIGKQFWAKVYAEAQKKFHTTNIPVNTFNKVWIVPAKAVVYENVIASEAKQSQKESVAYVVEAKLKVMLEEDYLALEKNYSPPLMGGGANDASIIGSQIVREIVLPQLEKEVNEGKNFAQLRQVYNSLILAAWYKKKIKDSILAKVYVDRNKVKGVGYNSSVIARSEAKKQFENGVAFPTARNDDVEAIYRQYLQAFKKGVFNYIKEEQSVIASPKGEAISAEMIPRKYFSGGMSMAMTSIDANKAMTITTQLPLQLDNSRAMLVRAKVGLVGNTAMMVSEKGIAQEMRKKIRTIIEKREKMVEAVMAEKFQSGNSSTVLTYFANIIKGNETVRFIEFNQMLKETESLVTNGERLKGVVDWGNVQDANKYLLDMIYNLSYGAPLDELKLKKIMHVFLDVHFLRYLSLASLYADTDEELNYFQEDLDLLNNGKGSSGLVFIERASALTMLMSSDYVSNPSGYLRFDKTHVFSEEMTEEMNLMALEMLSSHIAFQHTVTLDAPEEKSVIYELNGVDFHYMFHYVNDLLKKYVGLSREGIEAARRLRIAEAVIMLLNSDKHIFGMDEALFEAQLKIMQGKGDIVLDWEVFRAAHAEFKALLKQAATMLYEDSRIIIDQQTGGGYSPFKNLSVFPSRLLDYVLDWHLYNIKEGSDLFNAHDRALMFESSLTGLGEVGLKRRNETVFKEMFDRARGIKSNGDWEEIYIVDVDKIKGAGFVQARLGQIQQMLQGLANGAMNTEARPQVEYAKKLLENRIQRPDILEIAKMIQKEGLKEDDILKAGEDLRIKPTSINGYEDLLDGMKDYLLGFVKYVDEKELNDATFWVAARDGEILYDTLRLAKSLRGEDFSKIYLMQYNDNVGELIRKMSAEGLGRFLGAYGFTGQNQKYVLLDTGFYGSFAQRLSYWINNKLSLPFLFKPRNLLVSSGFNDQSYASMMDVPVNPDASVDKFKLIEPLIEPVRKSVNPKAADLWRYRIAVAMQILPKFHSKVLSLDGDLKPIVDAQRVDDLDLNTEGANDEHVNRVAALLLQYHLAEMLIKEKTRNINDVQLPVVPDASKTVVHAVGLGVVVEGEQDAGATVAKGGIDLTSGKLPLEVKKEIASSPTAPRNDYNFNIDPAMLKQWEEAPGVMAVIYNIEPMLDVYKFLGTPSVN